MNLPAPIGRNAGAWIPATDIETAARIQQLADHCHASTKMREATRAAAAYLDAHADHEEPRAPRPGEDGPYGLDGFMADAYRRARHCAAKALGPAAEVRMVIPMWVHTMQHSVINDVITVPEYHPTGHTWRAYAIAAADRVPSLIMMSWDWAAAFPCATPVTGEATTEPLEHTDR